MLEKNSSVQLNRNYEIKRQQRSKVFFVVILFILVFIAGIIGFLRRREFQIEAISVEGTRAANPTQIQSTAERFISGNYLLVIPKSNALIFSKSNLEQHLLETFPNLKSVTAEFPERNQLVVHVTEKEPLFVWCGSALPQGEGTGVGGCWFVDQDGIIYDEAPRFSDGVFVTFAGTVDGVSLPPDPRRSRFASAVEFDRISGIVTTLQELPADVISIAYVGQGTVADAQPTGVGDIAIRVGSLKDFRVNPDAPILITNKTTVESLKQSLILLMNEGKFVDVLKTKGGSLEYIDLRFEGKIYYKFK